MRTTTVAVLILALTASSSIAEAQATRRDANRGPERARVSVEERGRMFGAARGGNPGAWQGRGERAPAAALLRQRARLGLTDEQATQLEALAATQREALKIEPSEQLRMRADLLDATGRNANPTAARAALDKMSDARNARLVAAMQAREQTRAVLTAEQLSTLDAVRGQLGQRGQRGAMRSGKMGERRRGGEAPNLRQGRPPQGPRNSRG